MTRIRRTSLATFAAGAVLAVSMSNSSYAAPIVNLSLGESATAGGGNAADIDGAGTEVINGQTWNNLAVDTTGTPVGQALLDSSGNATGLSATSEAAGEFNETRGDINLENIANNDVANPVLSAFGSNGAGGIPTVTISGFAANQQLGDLIFWSLGDPGSNQGATQTITINGVSQGSSFGVFIEGPDVFSNVTANASGELIITASNHIAALQLDIVPEPSSLALLGLGGLCVLRRRRH